MRCITNSPAALERPGHGIRKAGSKCSTTLTADDLAFAAEIRVIAMRDKTYQRSPVGSEIALFMQKMKWEGRSPNSLESYETVLAKFALDFAHKQSLAEITTKDLRLFLDNHWGECAPATKRSRLAIIRSFFTWIIEDEDHDLTINPAKSIKSPKRVRADRQAYAPDMIDHLRRSQPTLCDQIGIQLLGRLGLRKNELRLLQISDFNLAASTVRVQGKGGKVVIMPYGGFRQLTEDLALHLIGLAPDEYLLYPKNHRTRPLTPPNLHRWFKRCLRRAELPQGIKLHEMRHSAGDNIWRKTGNLAIAQILLRHESPATTADYLHPTHDDLVAGQRLADE